MSAIHKQIARGAGVGRNNNFPRPPSRRSGDRQIFAGASEANEQVMVIRIDGRGPPREVRLDIDRVGANAEPPRLRVMAIGGECRVADEIAGFRRPQVTTDLVW